MDYISDFDLIFKSETGQSKTETWNFDISGFYCELVPGNKFRNTTRGRYSGGLAFYYKDYLKHFVSVVKKEQSGILWIKISEELFSFDQNVFICNIYVPSTDTKVFNSSNTDLYDQLEQDIIKFNDLGKVFVFGDSNGRTSNDIDYFKFDKYFDQNSTFDIPIRVNKDHILDYNGRHLIDICQSTGLLIANGRLLKDRKIGKFTFCGHRGQSTVHYLLFNFQDFETLSYFDFLELNEYSDHAPLSFHIRLKSQYESENTFERNEEITHKIVWDNERVADFKSLLINNNDLIQRLTSDVASETVDDVVNNFTQFLHDKVSKICGKTYSKRNRPQRLNKEWFDDSCKNAKREFTTVRNIFNRLKMTSPA